MSEAFEKWWKGFKWNLGERRRQYAEGIARTAYLAATERVVQGASPQGGEMKTAIYVPKVVEYGTMSWEKISRIQDENREQLERCDRLAKRSKSIIGRYIQHQFADGYAIYQIIRELRGDVYIKVCVGLGDDWVLPAWGRGCWIDKTTAIQFLKQRDMLAELFSGGGYE